MKNIKSVLQLSPSEKAFIYQQIADFEPFCLPDSEVDVLIQEGAHQNEKKAHFLVAFTLTGGGAKVQSVGESDSFYEAAKEAKANLLSHLYMIQKKVIQEELGTDPLTHPEDSTYKWLH